MEQAGVGRGLGPVLAVVVAVAMLWGCGEAGSQGRSEAPSAPLTIGLYTSLPIFWPEADRLGELLTDDAPPHWALASLKRRGRVSPLDSLAGPERKLPLARADILLMAQPYPLSPQENVALDDWVRAGGRVLIFADPMLTRESIHAPGDRRRPQDVVLVSPILHRWGLDLQFDETQPFGQREASIPEGPVPVNLPGRFAILPQAEGCELEADGLLADCRIAKGHVVALADAALLDETSGSEAEMRAAVLDGLLDRLSR